MPGAPVEGTTAAHLPLKLDIVPETTANSPTMPKILVLHGPNLNLLGQRETHHYGHDTLQAIDDRLVDVGRHAGASVVTFQSNAEGPLIDRVHGAKSEQIDFILINPAAFTHTSVALRDALAGVGIPFIEVHLSNVHAREPFRQHSYFSDIAVGVIAGLGAYGYELALHAALRTLAQPRTAQPARP
jgi:3-dehydroquinate dehydratase-2